ncbi:MAG: Lrp/AsnC ligand binding domain-containing protein [Thermoplasmata archaeon]|jgi:DNA-binding Lrp family transcriptional regulator|nr:Lrp/AsnC ligand binding domain-containing protein [Thermoplasmata archaeon]
MPAEGPRELTLYVQSKKAVTSFYRPPASRTSEAAALSPDYRPSGRTEDDAAGTSEEVFFLSDDQARCLAVTEEIAKRRSYTVKVVDVAKVGRLERLVTEHLRGVTKFPVLIGPSGQRVEGTDAFTEEALFEMMPAEMSTLRAFTYLKVRGGDLDRIREQVLGFTEVKELHLLTGDWDVFLVLEFPAGGNMKRRILDFVTDRIRGIPEVLDTSTLVPEYSVTKFPS